MKKEPIKISPEDFREKLWVEESYLLYLNDCALEVGLICENNHNKMVRKIKHRTYEHERRMKETLH